MDACASMSRSSWFLRDLRQFMSPYFISDPFRGFLSCPSQSRICKLSPISSNSTPMVMHIYLAKNLSTRTSSQLPSQVPNMRKYGQSPTVFNHDAPNRTHGSSSSKKNGWTNDADAQGTSKNMSLSLNCVSLHPVSSAIPNLETACHSSRQLLGHFSAFVTIVTSILGVPLKLFPSLHPITLFQIRRLFLSIRPINRSRVGTAACGRLWWVWALAQCWATHLTVESPPHSRRSTKRYGWHPCWKDVVACRTRPWFWSITGILMAAW